MWTEPEIRLVQVADDCIEDISITILTAPLHGTRYGIMNLTQDFFECTAEERPSDAASAQLPSRSQKTT